MPEDKRRHHRVQAPFTVKLTLPDQGSFTTQTRDLSEGGAFVIIQESDVTPTLHMRLQIQVLGLPMGPGEAVECEVVRLTDDGIGVRFLDNQSD